MLTYSSHNGLMQFTFDGLPDDVTTKELKALTRMVYNKEGSLSPVKSGYTSFVSTRGVVSDVFFSGIVFHSPFVQSKHQTMSLIVPTEKRVSDRRKVEDSMYMHVILKVLGITAKTFFSKPRFYIAKYLSHVIRNYPDEVLMRKQLNALRSLWTLHLATKEVPFLFYRGAVENDIVLQPEPITSIKMRSYDGSLMNTLHEMTETDA